MSFYFLDFFSLPPRQSSGRSSIGLDPRVPGPPDATARRVRIAGQDAPALRWSDLRDRTRTLADFGRPSAPPDDGGSSLARYLCRRFWRAAYPVGWSPGGPEGRAGHRLAHAGAAGPNAGSGSHPG